MAEPRHSHEDASDDPWETTSLKMRKYSTRRENLCRRA